MSDWTDALAALRGGLPDGPDPQPEPGTPAPDESAAPADTLLVQMEKRRGKPATIVSGFSCSDADLRDIAARLKTGLGTGGSARGGEILIQGDRRADVARMLRERGYRVRGA